jgi:hypothetical protein
MVTALPEVIAISPDAVSIIMVPPPMTPISVSFPDTRT